MTEGLRWGPTQMEGQVQMYSRKYEHTYTQIGSVVEEESERGIAHIVEHLVRELRI